MANHVVLKVNFHVNVIFLPFIIVRKNKVLHFSARVLRL